MFEIFIPILLPIFRGIVHPADPETIVPVFGLISTNGSAAIGVIFGNVGIVVDPEMGPSHVVQLKSQIPVLGFALGRRNPESRVDVRRHSLHYIIVILK